MLGPGQPLLGGVGADSAWEGKLSSGDRQGAQSVLISEATGVGVWRLSPESPEKARELPILLTIWLQGSQVCHGDCGCGKDTSGPTLA